jgi:hypothetical protein
MKKVLFILVLALLVVSVFAIDGYIRASDWYNYYFICDYAGMYAGQGRADSLTRQYSRTQPAKVHLEVINEVLDHYNTEIGETYLVFLTKVWDGQSAGAWYCVCEFTSNTRYKYWFFRV